jgi:hypothetical protein
MNIVTSNTTVDVNLAPKLITKHYIDVNAQAESIPVRSSR